MYSKFNTSLHSDLGSGAQGFHYLGNYPMLEAQGNVPRKGWRKFYHLARAQSKLAFPEMLHMEEAATVDKRSINMQLDIAKRIACEEALVLARAKGWIPKFEESGDALSVLPSKEISALIRADFCTLMVSNQTLEFVPDPSLEHLKQIAIQIQDAFSTRIQNLKGESISILPKELLYSSMIAKHKHESNESYGRKVTKKAVPVAPNENVPKIITQIVDPKNQFAAAIIYVPEEREVIIGFSSAPSTNLKNHLLLCHLLNLMGFCPKAFSKAAKLTELVKTHLAKINEELPDEKQIVLTLAGARIGGGYAMYAGLRNGVHANVISPVTIGSGLLRRVGNLAVHDVQRLITEVVMQKSHFDDAIMAFQRSYLSGFYTNNVIKQTRRVLLSVDSTDDNDAAIHLYHELIKNKQIEITLRTYLKNFLVLLVNFRTEGIEISRRALREFTEGKIVRTLLELFERVPSGLSNSAKQEIAVLMQQRYDVAFKAIQDPQYAIDMIAPFSESLSILIERLKQVDPLAQQSSVLDAISKDCEADQCHILKRRASTLAGRLVPRIRSYLSKGSSKRRS